MSHRIAVLFTLVFALAATSASAAKNRKKWDKEHPRRHQVIKRENKDKQKFAKDEANGKITGKQEQKLDSEENKIRQEERADAAKHHGHITKKEQRHLNREERHVENQEQRMEGRDSALKQQQGAGQQNNQQPAPAQ